MKIFVKVALFKYFCPLSPQFKRLNLVVKTKNLLKES